MHVGVWFRVQSLTKHGVEELLFTSDNGMGIQVGDVPGGTRKPSVLYYRLVDRVTCCHTTPIYRVLLLLLLALHIFLYPGNVHHDYYVSIIQRVNVSITQYVLFKVQVQVRPPLREEYSPQWRTNYLRHIKNIHVLPR